jgi:geranylgeranyl pyrophosphate synthase
MSPPNRPATAAKIVNAATNAGDAVAASLQNGSMALDVDVPTHIWDAALMGPALNFLQRPGKEFRARFTKLAFMGSFGGTSSHATKTLARLGAIIEVIHAGSLIIDDVQDQSEQRRGQPALHLQIGVPLAINTGSWMYFWALSQIFQISMVTSQHAIVAERAMQTLMRCHQGQALDLSVRVSDLEPKALAAVASATTRGKSGALFGFAGFLAASAAGAASEVTAAWSTFGEEFGVGLQMLDDLGSIAASSRRDKGTEDVSMGRVTWPWVWLAEHSDEITVARLMQLSKHAEDGEVGELIDSLAIAVGAVGRGRVKQHLNDTVAGLEPFTDADTIKKIRAEISRLEASYG